MPVTIKNRYTGETIATVEDTDDLRTAVIRLVRQGVSLHQANLRAANLRDADLRDADLSDADLRDANLRGADLSDANLSDANLRDAKSTLFPLVAVQSLHRRMLAAIERGGKLEMEAWHTCETAHCRAGWAVHLAGPAGGVLEACFGSAVAGAFIHLASCPQLEGKVPNFYDNNESALADIKRLAELEPELTTH